MNAKKAEKERQHQLTREREEREAKLKAANDAKEKQLFEDLIYNLVNLAREGELEKIEDILIEKNFEKKVMNKLDVKSGQNCLLVAANDGRFEIAQMLLDNKAEPNCRDRDMNTPSCLAAMCGHFELLDLLVHHGADVAKRGAMSNTPLHYASKYGQLACVKYIIPLFMQKGIDIDSENDSKESALAIALKCERFEVASALLAAGASINASGENGNTALSRCAFDGRVDTLRFLLDNGADVTHRNAQGETAFFTACKRYLQVPAALLLEHGADVNDCDPCGRSALMYAAMAGKMDMVNLLIGHGCDVDARDMRGYTALMFASMNVRSPDVVAMLLARGADINCTDRDFNSAFIYACMKNNVNAANLLLDNGADPRARNGDDKMGPDLLVDPVAKQLLLHKVTRLEQGGTRPRPSRWPRTPKPIWLLQQHKETAEHKAHNARVI